MDKNYEIIQDILTRAIQITVSQKQDISWEFYPLTKILKISIPFNEGGLIKTYGIDIKDTEGLQIVQKELMTIQSLEDDFLGH